MAGAGRRVRVRRLGADVYEVETPDGVRLLVRLDGDVVVTDYGSYYLPDLLAEVSGSREVGEAGGGSWLAVLEGGVLRAAVSLKVVELYASEGSRIRRGDRLACVETMKMLEYLISPCDGVVEKVYVRAGEGVPRGSPLLKLRCEG